MTRFEHLAFCGICEKRSFDNMKGIVCGLTQDYATFEESCPDFELDNSRKSELERETEANLFDAADKKSAKTYKTSELLTQYSQLEPKRVYTNSKGLNWFRFGLGGFIIAAFVIAMFQDNEVELVTNPFSYLILLLGGSLIYMSTRSIKDRSPKLVIDETGITKNEEAYKWRQIIDAQLAEVRMHKTSNEYYLQFCVHPAAKLVEINVGELDGTPAQLGATFEFYRTKALQK